MPLRRLRLAPIPLLSALLLTACASGPPVAVKPLAVPESLLSCQAEPTAPDPAGGDAPLGAWIVDLADAGADCRDKLAAVRTALGR